MQIRLFHKALIAMAAVLLLSCGQADRLPLITQESDLAGCEIGIVTSASHAGGVQRVFPESEILYFEDLGAMCLALEKGKIDAMVCMKQGSDELLLRHPGFRELPSAEMLDTASVCFSPDRRDLADAFNTFLSEIKADGTYDAMRHNWFGEDAPRKMFHPAPVEGEPLRVGVETGQSFLTIVRENEPAGFEPELLQRFGIWCSRPVELVEMSGGGMIPALLSGRIDAAASGITPTRERSRRMLFSDPYDISPLSVIVRGQDHGASFASFKENLHTSIIAEKRYLLILNGLLITLAITLSAVLFGGILGILLCLMKRRGPVWMKKFAHGYCVFVEAIPIVVLLLFMFYVVFAATDITALTVAIITFSLHFAAGACESLDASISDVDPGQWDGGLALGFTRFQTLYYVIFPQALFSLIPRFKGIAIALIENTAIVGFIALKDMTKVTDIIRSQTYDSLIPLVIVGVIYYLIARLLALLFDKLGNMLIRKRAAQ